MTKDMFDELLDESAPTTATQDVVSDALYAQMIADAGKETRPRRHRRLALAGIGAGLAVVLAGGGLAVAGGMVWGKSAGDAAGKASFSYILPSGRHCQVGVSIFGAELAVQDAARWLEKTDVKAQLDLESARRWDQEQAKFDPRQTAVLDPDRGLLMDAPIAPDERTPDDVAALVVERAAAMVAVSRLAESGVAMATGHSAWQYGNGDSGVTAIISCTVDAK